MTGCLSESLKSILKNLYPNNRLFPHYCTDAAATVSDVADSVIDTDVGLRTYVTTDSFDHGASFLPDPPLRDLTARRGSVDENSSIITHKAAELTSVCLATRPGDAEPTHDVSLTVGQSLFTLQSIMLLNMCTVLFSM